MSFSFSFSGDDIDEGVSAPQAPQNIPQAPAAAASTSSAFPVQGKPQLPPVHHGLGQLLAKLPSKIAYSLLVVDLDGKGSIQIPRRELWDVRLQLMAEEDAEGDELEPGLGAHDVKTGIYEGGFKSWESSVDLVKVLAAKQVPASLAAAPFHIIELGCGTALPSLALFQWALHARAQAAKAAQEDRIPLNLTLADYNPSVLQLVTMPNLLLAWALGRQGYDQLIQDALSATEGELEITEQVVDSFKSFLTSAGINVSFISGGWSPELVELMYTSSASLSSEKNGGGAVQTLIMGAETIYSPFALDSFTDTLLSILRRERGAGSSRQAMAVIAAKRLYFGVGGSLDDFVDKMRGLGAGVRMLREETEGVRRGVVECVLP